MEVSPQPDTSGEPLCEYQGGWFYILASVSLCECGAVLGEGGLVGQFLENSWVMVVLPTGRG